MIAEAKPGAVQPQQVRLDQRSDGGAKGWRRQARLQQQPQSFDTHADQVWIFVMECTEPRGNILTQSIPSFRQQQEHGVRLRKHQGIERLCKTLRIVRQSAVAQECRRIQIIRLDR